MLSVNVAVNAINDDHRIAREAATPTLAAACLAHLRFCSIAFFSIPQDELKTKFDHLFGLCGSFLKLV